MAQLEIDKLYKKSNNKAYPIVANFLNAYTTDQFESSTCTLLENSDTQKKTLVTELEGLLFAGEEEEENLGQTLILVRNKNTGKVRLLESNYIDLKPILKTDLDGSQLLETSNLELSRKFGSKKQRQKMEQKEKLKMNVETVTEQVKKATEKVTSEQLDLTSYNNSMNSDEFYVPYIDRTASRVEHVYDIDKILTEEQYSKIESEIEDKNYTADMQQWIQDVINKSNSIKYKILGLFADSLVKLYATVVKDINKKGFIVCKPSITLNKYILDNFLTMNRGKYSRPSEFKDKSICHAIVYLLIINNFKVSLDNVCETFKLMPSTGAMKVRVTGATIINSDGKKFIQLKLPLSSKSIYRRKSTKF